MFPHTPGGLVRPQSPLGIIELLGTLALPHECQMLELHKLLLQLLLYLNCLLQLLAYLLSLDSALLQLMHKMHPYQDAKYCSLDRYHQALEY